MSRASKITLGCTLVLAVTSMIGVQYIQDAETELLRQGPIKDAKRMSEKTQRKLLMNQQEHEYQQQLRKQYEEVQPLSGKIITADDNDQNGK